LSADVSGALKGADRSATSAFRVQFSNDTFGKASDALFFSFDRPAVRKKTFESLKKTVGTDRRLLLREHLIVVFGIRSTQESSKLIINCVNEVEPG